MAVTCLSPIFLVNLMPKKKSPIVEQIFLIHKDGRLISYASLRGDEDIDENIVGGMLTALMNLLIDAFVKKVKSEQEIELYKFEFGERNIIIDMGNEFFIALVTLGKEDKDLLDKTDAIIKDIEEKYGDVFVDWSGDTSDFNGITDIIMTILPLEELSEAKRQAVKDEGFFKKVLELWAMMHEDE